MWQTILTAVALVLVIEGILPFLCPHCWRTTLIRLITLNNRILRTIGLISMVVGASIIYIINNFFVS